jgi:hypothetical protein
VAKKQIKDLESELKQEKQNVSKLKETVKESNEREEKITFLNNELVKQKALLEDTQRQREDARTELQNVRKATQQAEAQVQAQAQAPQITAASKKRKQKECYTNRDNYAQMTDDQIVEDLQCGLNESCKITDRNQSGVCVPNDEMIMGDEIAKDLVFKNNKSVRVIGKPQDIDYIYNNFIARVERVQQMEKIAKESVPVLPPPSKQAPPPPKPQQFVPPSATNKGSISRLQAALKQYNVTSKPTASSRIEYARYAPETVEKEREKALQQTYDIFAQDPNMFNISQECEAILKSKQ